MRTKFDKNEIIKDGQYAYIILYDKYNQEKARTKIDIFNIDLVKDIKWYLRNNGYVATNNYNGSYMYLHNLLIDRPNKKYIDHIDRDRLNNTLSNLRVADYSENGMNKSIRSDNKSGVTGVHWSKQNNKWCAMICFRKKHINLGYFDDFNEAVKCRKSAEKHYFKQFKPIEEEKEVIGKKIFHMHLPDQVHLIFDKLNQEGHEAVVVGGCVRDVLLGKEPHDYDIATSAFPEEIMKIFDGERMILDGLKHGTVTVIYDHTPYEITTYRIDGKYTDHRRPDKVEFSRNLEDDLSRRDFTINALAYDREYIYDFFGGMDDIERKIIRCVGNPADRISEDPLRIMRALRFSAQLGFVIDEATSNVILDEDNIKLLEMIAQERKSGEFNKLLGGDNIVMVFWQYFPIIRSLYSGFMLIDNPFETAMKIRDSMNLYERIAILCEDMSIDLFEIDQEVDFLCKAMRYSNQIKKNVVEIMKVWKKELLFPGEICARHLLYKYQFANAISGIRCKIIEFEITSLQKEKSVLILHLNELINTINSIEENKEDCHSIRALAVGGHELKAIGITDKDVGKWLNTLTELVMNGAVDNNSVDLLNIVLLNS